MKPTMLKKTKVKKHRNSSLKLNTAVSIYEDDPTFESNQRLPFISVSAHSKLAIRAVLTSNQSLLRSLTADKQPQKTLPAALSQIDKATLEAMITRVMAPPVVPPSTTIH